MQFAQHCQAGVPGAGIYEKDVDRGSDCAADRDRRDHRIRPGLARRDAESRLGAGSQACTQCGQEIGRAHV